MKKTVIIGVVIFVLFLSSVFGQSIGSKAPEVTGPDFKGKKHKLSQYRGKVVLLKFWASWCAPCRHSLPGTFKKLKKYKKKGFMVMVVGLGQRKSDYAVLRQYNVKFNVELYGRNKIKYHGYQFRGIPFAVLISRSGKVLWKGHRGLPGRIIEKALSEKYSGK